MSRVTARRDSPSHTRSATTVPRALSKVTSRFPSPSRPECLTTYPQRTTSPTRGRT